MRNKLLLTAIFLSGIFLSAQSCEAHQPKIVFGEAKITVNDPEISKAYYGKLEGEPDYFEIRSDKPFALYVNILVPDMAGISTELIAKIEMDGKIIATLDGRDFDWKKFYEPFGGDNYLQGPEFRAQVEAGNYTIKVYSPDNSEKYSLAVGKTESFGMKEAVKAILAIPTVKKDFFDESALSATFNQATLLLIAVVASIGAMIILGVWILRKSK